MKKAFVVVGHSNWGKSRTLQSLTNDSYRLHWFKIDGKLFYIRRMSNDDDSGGLLKFVEKIDANQKPYLIFTLCPEFIKKNRKTKMILDKMRDKYNLYFWVNKHKYGSREEIDDASVCELSKYGTVNIYKSRSDCSVRAAEFVKFIRTHLYTALSNSGI